MNTHTHTPCTHTLLANVHIFHVGWNPEPFCCPILRFHTWISDVSQWAASLMKVFSGSTEEACKSLASLLLHRKAEFNHSGLDLILYALKNKENKENFERLFCRITRGRTLRKAGGFPASPQSLSGIGAAD